MKSEIVVDGAKRRLCSDHAKKRREELNKQFFEEFSNELNKANFFKRILIRQKIRKKVDQQIREEFDQGLQHLNLKMKL